VSDSDLKPRLLGSVRAVSPIIGVILKVALAVVFATVVITAVLTIVPDADPGPQVTFETIGAPENGTVEFVHVSGDTIRTEQLRVTGAGTLNQTALGPEVTAGERIRVEKIVAEEGDTISLAWDSEEETESVLLAERTLRADHTGIDNPPSGEVEILDTDIQPGDTFDVRTSNYENTTSAFLGVRNKDTGDEKTFADISETTVTVDTDDINADDGDTIRVGLYASDDRAVLLDTDNETVTNGGGGGGPIPGFSFTTVGLALLLASLLGRSRNEGGEAST
jgi:FlaG/FlaF family flagellin (archaellin)